MQCFEIIEKLNYQETKRFDFPREVLATTPSQPSAISDALVVLNSFNEIFYMLLKLKCFNRIVSDPRDDSGTNEKSGRSDRTAGNARRETKEGENGDTNRNDSHTFHAAGS